MSSTPQNGIPVLTLANTRHYLVTRIPTLKPPLTFPPNPIRLLHGMSTINWLLYIAGYVFSHLSLAYNSLRGHGTVLTFSALV